MQVIAFMSKRPNISDEIVKMAESVSVPIQLQSVALLRGGFKRFVKARDEEVEQEAEARNEVTAINGDAVKQIYEDIIAAPSLPLSKEQRNVGKREVVKSEEVIALSDTDDDDLEMVDTSANKELLLAVQQVGFINNKINHSCKSNNHSPRVTFLQQSVFASVITTAPILMDGPHLK